MRLFCTTMPNGDCGIISIDDDEKFVRRLAKTMFELSRNGSDALEHFNPQRHTLETIAAGIPEHYPMTCRQITEADFPEEWSDRGTIPTYRMAWIDTGTEIIIDPVKAGLLGKR